MREIDHLVYCVPNLEKAIIQIHKLTGIKPIVGGRHKTKGTKNALLDLGNSCYLELLAVDEENTNFPDNRWMGIDFITEKPRLTRWAIKGENIHDDSVILKGYNSKMGVIDQGSRQVSEGSILRWQMALPLSFPMVELVPFVTDWSESETHPTEKLDSSCKLVKLEFEHPDPDKILEVYKKLNIELNVLRGDKIEITAIIQSPKGLIKLS